MASYITLPTDAGSTTTMLGPELVSANLCSSRMHGAFFADQLRQGHSCRHSVTPLAAQLLLWRMSVRLQSNCWALQ